MVHSRYAITVADGDNGLHDWERIVLRHLNVTAIEHGGSYDLTPMTEDGKTVLKKQQGASQLVAVLKDGRRVGIPESFIDPELLFEPMDYGEVKAGDAEKVIMAIFPCREDLRLALTFVRTSALDGIFDSIIDHDDVEDRKLSWFLEGTSPYYRKLSEDENVQVRRVWLDLLNEGVVTTLDNVLTLAMFLHDSGPFTRSGIPDFIIGRLRAMKLQSIDWIAMADLNKVRLTEFRGNDHMAWALVDAFMQTRDDNDFTPLLALLSMLTGPYANEEVSAEFEALLDDGDFPGLSNLFRNMVIKNDGRYGHCSWSWLLDVVRKAKDCKWNVRAFNRLVREDNGPILRKIRDIAYSLDGSITRNMEEWRRCKGFHRINSYAYKEALLTATPEALRGVRLVRQAFDDGEVDGHNDGRLVPIIVEALRGEPNVASWVVMHTVMFALEDVAIAHDEGVPFSSLVGSMNSFIDSRPGDPDDPESNDYGALCYVHWIANKRPDLAGLPYSFCKELPDYDEYVYRLL